jgi:transposase-like protein
LLSSAERPSCQTIGKPGRSLPSNDPIAQKCSKNSDHFMSYTSLWISSCDSLKDRLMARTNQQRSLHKKNSQRKASYQPPILSSNAIVANHDELRAAHPDVTDSEAQIVEIALTTGKSMNAISRQINVSPATVRLALMRERVVAYRSDLAQRTLGWASAQALTTMRQLLAAKSSYVRLEAARDLMDRAGMRAPETHTQPASVAISFNLAAEPKLIVQDTTTQPLLAPDPAPDGKPDGTRR